MVGFHPSYLKLNMLLQENTTPGLTYCTDQYQLHCLMNESLVSFINGPPYPNTFSIEMDIFPFTKVLSEN